MIIHTLGPLILLLAQGIACDYWFWWRPFSGGSPQRSHTENWGTLGAGGVQRTAKEGRKIAELSTPASTLGKWKHHKVQYKVFIMVQSIIFIILFSFITNLWNKKSELIKEPIQLINKGNIEESFFKAHNDTEMKMCNTSVYHVNLRISYIDCTMPPVNTL